MAPLSLVAQLIVQAGSSGPVERIATTFGVDWRQLLAQAVSFGIVCFILQRWAYGPILRMLQVRREQIAEGVATAERITTELAKTEAQRREVMAQASEQASKFIDEARAAAARVREEEIQKAAAAAQQIVTDARAAAARERDRMLAELKREVGRLAVQAAATVTGKILTSEDQRRLAEEAARQVTG